MRDDDRVAVVTAFAQRGHEGDLREQRHFELRGQLRATPGAEELVALAVVAARCATRCAAGCGVVTTMTSARGMNCAIDNETSPVPGGMSITR